MNDSVNGTVKPMFAFLIQTGSKMPNLEFKTYRMLKLEDDAITVEMNEEVKRFNSTDIYHDIYNLVIENKDKIIELSNHQDKQMEEHTLRPYKDSSKDELGITHITLGSRAIFITNKVDDKLVNDFYPDFRNKVFEILKSYM